MGFSRDGKLLVSVGLDNDHTMALWDWEKGRVIASEKSSKERIFDIQLSPFSDTIVTVGVKHVSVSISPKRVVYLITSSVLEVLWECHVAQARDIWEQGRNTDYAYC
jgi:WD40 repeat protein